MGRERLGEQGTQDGQYHVGDDVKFENFEEEQYHSTHHSFRFMHFINL